MTDLTTQDLITHTRELWNTGKKVMIQVAWNLAQIQKSDAWKNFKTFPQFCEQELDIQQSQVSKLLTIAEYYLEKYSVEEIGSVDYEKLYKSALLPGSVEENLARAKTLTRAELKETNVNEGHVHSGEIVKIHKCCGMRINETDTNQA